ncbi:MAG: radical SAM protein, partial [Myxococcales bacterium]|nr:radical SAM protein [Myxococcales bacterium]
EEVLADIDEAGEVAGADVAKVFLADGDALVLPTATLLRVLERARARLPNLERVSCYAMARNVMEKSDAELAELAAAGLGLLYVGPESGDDVTLRRIAKGDDAKTHVAAAERAHAAGMKLSVIALLGIAGERSAEHAQATGELVTKMDPEFFSALTVTVVPGTPLATLERRGRFAVPDVRRLLVELRTMVEGASPRDAVFRTNHASNYLPLAGRLPRDRGRIVAVIDAALAGQVHLRPEWSRGL